jgi:CPA2 family monovalent cation:H+ antiporter-2
MLPDEVDQAYLRDQVVIVGYGGVGRRITENLINENIKVVIAEENREIVEKLRANIAAVSGVATEPSVLIQAHIMHARLLVITDGYFRYSSYCRYCQTIKPQIQVLICAESKEEAVLFARKILVKYSMQKKKWQRI